MTEAGPEIQNQIVPVTENGSTEARATEGNAIVIAPKKSDKNGDADPDDRNWPVNRNSNSTTTTTNNSKLNLNLNPNTSNYDSESESKLASGKFSYVARTIPSTLVGPASKNKLATDFDGLRKINQGVKVVEDPEEKKIVNAIKRQSITEDVLACDLRSRRANKDFVEKIDIYFDSKAPISRYMAAIMAPAVKSSVRKSIRSLADNIAAGTDKTKMSITIQICSDKSTVPTTEYSSLVGKQFRNSARGFLVVTEKFNFRDSSDNFGPMGNVTIGCRSPITVVPMPCATELPSEYNMCYELEASYTVNETSILDTISELLSAGFRVTVSVNVDSMALPTADLAATYIKTARHSASEKNLSTLASRCLIH